MAVAARPVQRVAGGDPRNAQARLRADPDAGRAGLSRCTCTVASTPAGVNCSMPASPGKLASIRANSRTSCQETAADRGEATGPWRRFPPPCRTARVEITGPVDRKMVINALNSGAQGVHGGLRGFHAPTWDNNARRPAQSARCRGRHASTFTQGPSGKQHTALKPRRPAVLVVRPRGWHLPRSPCARRRPRRCPARCSISACICFHNAADAACGRRPQPLFLPAEDWRAIARRALERRRCVRAKREARPAARLPSRPRC